MIILAGRYAGRKAIVVKAFDEASKEHKFGHALVAGIDRSPLKVTKSMGQKKILKRSRVKPFIKYINYNHMMPTRYTVTDIELKNIVKPEALKKQDTRETARKELKKTFEDRSEYTDDNATGRDGMRSGRAHSSPRSESESNRWSAHINAAGARMRRCTGCDYQLAWARTRAWRTIRALCEAGRALGGGCVHSACTASSDARSRRAAIVCDLHMHAGSVLTRPYPCRCVLAVGLLRSPRLCSQLPEPRQEHRWSAVLLPEAPLLSAFVWHTLRVSLLFSRSSTADAAAHD